MKKKFIVEIVCPCEVKSIDIETTLSYNNVYKHIEVNEATSIIKPEECEHDYYRARCGYGDFRTECSKCGKPLEEIKDNKMFKYMNEVRIIKGFYKGYEGYVIDIRNEKQSHIYVEYEVEITSVLVDGRHTHKDVWFCEKDLELIKE